MLYKHIVEPPLAGKVIWSENSIVATRDINLLAEYLDIMPIVL